MRLVTLTFALLISPAAHAVRGVAPGTPCERVPEIEEKLGSTKLDDSVSDLQGNFTMFFSGRSHGRDAKISYTCESGRVTSQLVATEVVSEQEGHALFSDWHRDLSAQLGPPSKDLDEPSVRQLQEAFQHPTRRFAAWVVGARVVSLAFWNATGESWEVVVSGP